MDNTFFFPTEFILERFWYPLTKSLLQLLVSFLFWFVKGAQRSKMEKEMLLQKHPGDSQLEETLSLLSYQTCIWVY